MYQRLERLKNYLEGVDLFTDKLEIAFNRFIEMEKKLAKENSDKFTWGKYKGKKVEDILKIDPGYVAWMVKQKYCSQGVKEIFNKFEDKL